jgi:hypothetical protein
MMQIIQQTDEEKMAMYMKLPKKEIIAMLIQCNKILDSRMVVNENFVQHNIIGQYHAGKMCNCKKMYRSTANVPCDGRCE